jgi:hypothetical protein
VRPQVQILVLKERKGKRGRKGDRQGRKGRERSRKRGRISKTFRAFHSDEYIPGTFYF